MQVFTSALRLIPLVILLVLAAGLTGAADAVAIGDRQMYPLERAIPALFPIAASTESSGTGSVIIPVEDLPTAETYIAMKRIRYLPGAQLTEPPTDGPKLLIVLSGDLTIQTPIAGARSYIPSAAGAMVSPIKARVERVMTSGEIVVIPAGIPAQFGNASEAPVEWIQIQVESPATLCACGEDLSVVQMEVLASQTLPQAITSPATLSLAQQRLDPGSEIPKPEIGTIQLVGAASAESTGLALGNDGSVGNEGSAPIEVIVARIVGADAAQRSRIQDRVATT